MTVDTIFSILLYVIGLSILVTFAMNMVLNSRVASYIKGKKIQIVLSESLCAKEGVEYYLFVNAQRREWKTTCISKRIWIPRKYYGMVLLCSKDPKDGFRKIAGGKIEVENQSLIELEVTQDCKNLAPQKPA
jgi:hypothetical protein